MSEETDAKRKQYIDEALAYADQHDRWTSPCVWWICDFKDDLQARHILALYDVISTLRTQLSAAKEAIEELKKYRPTHWCMNAPGNKDIPKSQCEACQINDSLSKLEAEHGK